MSRNVRIPRAGKGSSGSWRDPDEDTTHSHRQGSSGAQVGAGKLGFRGEVKEEPHAHEHKTPVGVRRDKNGNLKPQRFVSLHHHSTFSYLDGYQLPEAHVRRAAELGMSALALTEHGNMASHVKLEKAAKAEGIKPIFGCELYTGAVDETNRTRKKNHLTILAKDQEGYGNLISLVSRSYSEGFYSEPTVSEEMLAEEGSGLIVMSGCQGSLLFTSLVGGKLVEPEDASYKRGLGVAERFRSNFGDRYFLEVQAFPELEKTRQANPMIERISRATGIPLVADLDCHYTAPEESEVQKILHNTRPGEKRSLEELERDWGYDAPLCPPINDNVLFRRLVATGMSREAAREAILNTETIAQDCNVTLPQLPMIEYPLPPGYSDLRSLWRDWIKDGWRYRGIHKLAPAKREEYRKRLLYEMEMIESKGFEWYFVVVADSVVWAKDHGVAVGPGRGSAAASLVAYLLRITEVDPIVFHQLVFERFIDANRHDLPDIDLDFDSETRWKLREYLVRKYGEGRVYNLGTFTYYRSKNSLDDVARVYNVPDWDVKVIKDQLIERSSGDLRASATIEDTVEQFEESREVMERYPELRRAADLEGNVKGFGVHAAGLVLGDVRKVAPVYQRTIKGHEIEVVSVDLKDAERLGLLKMDYLGLNTMTLINYACTWLGLELQDMYDLPLDDQTTLDGFRRGDVIGIFQYEGQATRLINNELKPDNFDEVCLVPAIARPGPLHNGAAEAYVQVKRGDVEPERWHPSLEPILGFTNHQIVYQEQILRIVREVGDFDWTAAAAIRKIIAKKEGEQAFNRKRQEFLDGAARRHPDFEPDKVYALWMSLITAGAYSFNLAHSLAYGMISYQCQWIKQHHPEVFYAAALRAMGDGARVPLLRDADAHAIKATPPKLGGKALDWTPVRDGGKVRMGYKQLPKVGDALAEEIVRTPGRRRWTAWEDMIEVKGIGPKTIEGIKEFGASDDPLGIFEIDKRIAIAREAIEASETMTAPTHSSLDVPYGEGLKETVTWVGVALNRNLRDIFETNRAHGTELDEATMKDPHLREFLLMLGDDGKELLRLRFDRWRYPQFKRPIWGTTLEKDVVWVQGYKPSWRAAREIYVTDFAVISVTDEEVAQWNQATSKTGSPSTRRTRPKVRFTRRSAIAA